MIYAIPYCLYIISLFVFLKLPKGIGVSESHYYPRFYIGFSLLFFLGCRGFIVTDWVSYYPFYDELPSFFSGRIRHYSERHPWENGFILYSSIIKSFTTNYFVYQLVSFLIDFIIINWLISRYVPKKYYVLAYICFFVFQGFVIETNLLRNSKAIMLFCLSIPSLNEKKYLRYIFINLIGSLFHISAIIYIPLIFLLNKYNSRKSLYFLFFLGNLFFLIKIRWLVPILEALLPMLGQSRFVAMIESYKLLTKEVVSYSIGFGYLERNVIYIMTVVFQKSILEKDKRLLPFINMIFIYSFIYLFFSEFRIFVQRLPMLIVCGYWIVVPMLYCVINKKNKKIFLILLFTYCIIKMIVQCNQPYYKYSNFIFNRQNFGYSADVLWKYLDKE